MFEKTWMCTSKKSMESVPDTRLILDTVEEFEKAVEAHLAIKRPIVVQITAEWCPRCPAFGAVIEALASEYQFTWAVNDASEPELIERFEIKQLPAYVFVPPDGAGAFMVVPNANAAAVRQTVVDNCSPVFTQDADF